MPKDQFGNLNQYINFLKTFKKVGKILPGNFYSFVYVIDRTQDYERIKFYDLMPLIFVTTFNTKTKTFTGINLHHLPVDVRKVWIDTLKKFQLNSFSKNKRLLTMADYDKLYLMFRKATKFSVRQYSLTEIRGLRRLENTDIDTAINFYSKTYYGANISMVEKKYLKFRI